MSGPPANYIMTISEAALTILGLTAEGPRYGYEIEDQVTARGLRDWLPIGQASLYAVLNQLQQHALVTVHAEPGAEINPAWRVYQITAAGRGVVQTALIERLRQPRGFGTGFELALLHLHLLRPAQVMQALVQHQTALTQQLDYARARHAALTDRTTPEAALLTHALALMGAEHTWLTTFIADWRARFPAAATPSPDATDSADPTATHQPTNVKAAKRAQIFRPPEE